MGSATRPHHSDDGQAAHLTFVRVIRVTAAYVSSYRRYTYGTKRRRPSSYCLTYFVSPPSTAGRDPGPSAPYTFPSASTDTPSPAVFQGRSS